MRERCNNSNHVGYYLYGGRGIKVIISWHDFRKWYLGNVTDEMVRPNVDRIDNGGNYEISNIQLIPARENAHKMLKENPRWDVKLDNMKKANDKRKEKVTIDGVVYESMNEASRVIGKTRGAVRRYVTRHKTSNFVTFKQKNRTILRPV